jgi:hypothetical protein
MVEAIHRKLRLATFEGAATRWALPSANSRSIITPNARTKAWRTLCGGPILSGGRVEVRDRLGGLLKYYHREAA